MEELLYISNNHKNAYTIKSIIIFMSAVLRYHTNFKLIWFQEELNLLLLLFTFMLSMLMNFKEQEFLKL